MKTVNIYTDGACRGNPGDGGWGVLIKYENTSKEIYGGEKNTTNNKMELLAPIKAIQKLKKKSEISIYTDSTYVRDGIKTLIKKWEKNGWKTAYKKPVKNKDLWSELDLLTNEFKIKWIWVKGHSTDSLNNEVDLIAREAANL